MTNFWTLSAEDALVVQRIGEDLHASSPVLTARASPRARIDVFCARCEVIASAETWWVRLQLLEKFLQVIMREVCDDLEELVRECLWRWACGLLDRMDDIIGWKRIGSQISMN